MHVQSERRTAIIEPVTLVVEVEGPSLQSRLDSMGSQHHHGLAPLRASVNVQALDMQLGVTQLQDLCKVSIHWIDAIPSLRRREVSLQLADSLHDSDMIPGVRGRWHRAIERVMKELESRRSWNLHPRFFEARRRFRLEHTRLYRQLRRSKISAENARRLASIERNQLSANDIFYFRSIIERELSDGGSSTTEAHKEGTSKNKAAALMGREESAAKIKGHRRLSKMLSFRKGGEATSGANVVRLATLDSLRESIGDLDDFDTHLEVTLTPTLAPTVSLAFTVNLTRTTLALGLIRNKGT